ncbi:MAG: hypothetical protein RR285_03940 [Acinetobacter sp.]
MKKQLTIAMLSTTLLVSGCASTGGFATAANGGCDPERTAAVGAILGAVAGYALSNGNGNSSAQNNRAMALGTLAGGALSAGICVAINAKTVQKQSATAVEQKYKQQYGSLPAQTRVTQYKTDLDSMTVNVGENVVVRSELYVVEGTKLPLSSLKETLVLKDSKGKVLKTITKDLTQSGSSSSGEFENSFSWKFPANVSKGNYTIETELLVNGNKVANNRKILNLV